MVYAQIVHSNLVDRWGEKMPTKTTWSFDGTESKIVETKTGDGEICQECGGYEGHFNHCKILQKEVAEGKWG